MHRAWTLLAIVVAGVGLLAWRADARTSVVFGYPYADVWPTVVRFLRVDRSAALREKDAESGYVLFDLPEGNRSWRGAIELVRAADGEGRESTRVILTLPDLPKHHEGALLDKLAAKLREEYGTPAQAPPRRPAEPRRSPDAGARGLELPRGRP
jgi:hypothetical protein